MQKLLRKPATVILGLVAVAILWAAFRPELLFVNKHVDDPFPATAVTTAAKHL